MSYAPEELLVQPRHRVRHIGVAQHERDVPPRGRLRHQAQRDAIERRDGAAEHRRVLRRFSPTAQRIAISRSNDTSAKFRRSSDNRFEAPVSSTVTDTLTSDVVTTSTAVRKRSNTSKSRRKKAVRHQHARRRDVDDRHVALARERRQLALRRPRRRAVISVPAIVRPPRVQDADRNVPRHRRQNRARVQHLGAEVRELGSFGKRQPRHERGCATTRGSAVSIPSTSVQI